MRVQFLSPSVRVSFVYFGFLVLVIMEDRLKDLSLVEEMEEGLIFDVDQDPTNSENLELCLVERFLTDKVIRVSIMKERMANIWRPVWGVSICEISSGVFGFQFYHKLDFVRVLNGGPWSFDNYMLILEPVKPGDIMSQIPLFHVCIWVQIHDLPAGFMTPVIGKHLRNYIGSLMEYDENNNVGVWRTFMRIKVRLDVRVPLKKEKKVKKPGGDWRVVKFRYEGWMSSALCVVFWDTLNTFVRNFFPR